MSLIKIAGRNHIFSPLYLKKQSITKENAINHQCVMVTKSSQLGLQDFTNHY